MMNTGLYTSDTPEWHTPPDLFAALDAEFGFTLDPASTDENALCDVHYTEADNGLTHSWAGHTVFLNPPYGRTIGHWMAKARAEADAGATVVCLVPARTDTAWWHDYCMSGEFRFLRGRVSFTRDDGKTGRAPFPSAIVILRPEQLRQEVERLNKENELRMMISEARPDTRFQAEGKDSAERIDHADPGRKIGE